MFCASCLPQTFPSSYRSDRSEQLPGTCDSIGTTKLLRQEHFVVYNADMPRSPTDQSRNADSAHDVPTLSKMVRDGWAYTIHRRRTRESLDYWFRQSERLNIARSHYGLRGTRFTDFARRIGR